jgi:hypothetical protein
VLVRAYRAHGFTLRVLSTLTPLAMLKRSLPPAGDVGVVVAGLTEGEIQKIDDRNASETLEVHIAFVLNLRFLAVVLVLLA